jgi:pyruvate,water dikinase
VSDHEQNWQKMVRDLSERAKELACLYRVEEVLQQGDRPVGEAVRAIVEFLPAGWQYSHICRVRFTLDWEVYTSEDFRESPWVQSSPIVVEEQTVGSIEVFYLQEVGSADRSAFLDEEQKLLDTIAERFGHFLFQKKLKETVRQWQAAQAQVGEAGSRQWQMVLELTERTDPRLFAKISRKMLNYLCWIGIEQARLLLQSVGLKENALVPQSVFESNKPSEKKAITSAGVFSRRVFEVAQANLSDEEILRNVQKWIRENRVGFLVKALENLDTSLSDIFDAVSRFHHLETEDVEITPYSRQNINVLLIHRLFTQQLDYIHIAKEYIDLGDVHEILRRTIFPPNSHGQLGGKSAGLFLAAQILKRFTAEDPTLARFRIPKTWYITSDGLQTFLNYNDLEEMLEQKYKSIEQIRDEYPNIIQIFKNSIFPAEIVNWLTACLDDFGEIPIIVRSSSLLEDRAGTSFSGKYKSLFLANQGSKHERLAALMDAVAEVYASVFAPDPIEYRRERGLTDFHEEMGIMVQEVVGSRVGQYFFPEFSGVAFSNNEFRWSPRIRREDGLLRMVPGLGTRAVDRLSDDYPRLLAPGQPGLRVNATVDETLYYSPRQIDVIDLKNNSFTTVDLKELLRESGDSYPGVENIFSVHTDGHLAVKNRLALDFARDELVATFEGVVGGTSFVRDIKALLDLLRDRLGKPVDVEFAVSGGRIHLLQCRGQSSSDDDRAVPIPKDVPAERVLFSARKYVSNGRVPPVSHVVLVDPGSYSALPEAEQLKRVGRAIGRLNSLLPKRQFILMGPGRWGSRGDIRLGVPVSYSEINNTAALIEIARKKGNYLPDLSFGTHFFQDLVEAGIRYLPLYPDESGTVYNEAFLLSAHNVLAELLPEYADLSAVLRVIDVPGHSRGQVLWLALNADADEALAYLDSPGTTPLPEKTVEAAPALEAGEHWRWRMRMAERLARQLDPRRFGVEAAYVIGSSKNATAGPASDIDLLIHFRGSEKQRGELLAWLEGWSLSLAEMNYVRTGIRLDRLLDVHLVSDEDVSRRSSYAVKIGAVTDPARPLPLGK